MNQPTDNLLIGYIMINHLQVTSDSILGSPVASCSLFMICEKIKAHKDSIVGGICIIYHLNLSLSL